MNEEYVRPVTVTGASILADFTDANALTEFSVLLHRVPNEGDQLDFVFGGRDVSVPLGSSETFRADPGFALDFDWQIVVPVGCVINVSVIGIR